MSAVTRATLTQQLWQGGCDVVTASRALTTMERKWKSGHPATRVAVPYVLETTEGTFVRSDIATDDEIRCAVTHVSREYLRGRLRRDYLLGVLHFAAARLGATR